MIKSIFTVTALLLAGVVSAQSPACCEPPASMLALAKTEAFAAAHDAPEPFQYAKPRGSMVSFATLDGKKASAYYVPSPEATSRVLIIYHEWWGLNDYIRR